MKCDKLEAEQWLDYLGEPRPCYPQKEVDSAIDELKREHHRERDEYIDWVNKLQKENAELKAMVTTDNSAVIARLEAENAELKEKLESVKATAYTESVDAGMALRKTKRALWMARKAHAVAMFAYWDSHYRDNPNAVYRNRTVDWLRNRWLLILDCCIKKEKKCEFTVATKFCPMCGRKLTDAK